jgi:peptidoglycan/LPS O-acetylase OafA/YrhL
VSSLVVSKAARALPAHSVLPSSAGIAAVHRPPALHIVARLTRYPELDIARGVFLALMISSHAVGLANVPAGAFLRSNFWLPRGWSTVGFQVLAGFTIGLLFAAADRRKQEQVWARAGRMFAVMLGSNVVLLACKYALWGELWRFRDPSWWIGAATLYTDASISIVLAPTILLLAAAPWLLALQRRVSSAWFTVFSMSMFIGAWAIYESSSAPAFPDGKAGWIILPLAGNGLVGLVLGSWWSRNEDARRSLRPRVASLAFVCLLGLVASLSTSPLVQMTIGTVLRFGAVLALAMMFGTRSSRPLVRCIAQLGRHSLAVFILHRPVIQAIQFAIAHVDLSASLRYAFLYPSTVGCMVVLCAFRDSDARVDRMFRAFHL